MTKNLGFMFADQISNILLIMMTLVMLAVYAKPLDASVKAPVPKAEFLITLDWTDGSQDDVDLYLKTPTGEIIFFKHPKSAIAFLDRDDYGHTGDSVAMPDGTIADIKVRREIITIRGAMAGEWTVNAHMYMRRDVETNHLTLTVTKLNPYSEVIHGQADMDEQGQEVTLANFVTDASGAVVDVYQAQTKMVGGGT